MYVIKDIVTIILYNDFFFIVFCRLKNTDARYVQ